MKKTGAHIVVEALKAAGVRVGFGIPGTHNIELYDVLAQDPGFHSVLVTDEQGASFMADGYARAGGRLAAVNLVPGAGLTHALSGIAEAFMDGIPMLVLSCGIRTDTARAYQLHDVDQAAMARPVCKKVFEPQNLEELGAAMSEAPSLALTPPCGPVMVVVPVNLYLFEGEAPATSSASPPPAMAADPQDVHRAVEALNGALNIGIYAGAGALGATDLMVKLADRLDALVYTTLAGKGIFPEKNSRWVWNTMGAALPPPLRGFEKDFDLLLAVGCRFGEVATASYGFKPPKNLIHIDVDPNVFQKNFPASQAWACDAGMALKALLESFSLGNKAVNSSRLEKLKKAHEKTNGILEKEGDKTRVHPHLFFGALQKWGGENAVFAADSGNGLFLAMEHLRLTQSRCFLGPFDYSCMGYSVPAAIGAKMACPERPVFALAGDGAFLMTGLELVTAKAERTGVIVFLLCDGELSQIAQFQERSLNRKTLTTLPPLDFRALAQAVDIPYLRLDRNEDIESVVLKALEMASTHRPVLVSVAIDYSQPTFFSKGVVKTNFLRFPWKDRFRLVKRMLGRHILPNG